MVLYLCADCGGSKTAVAIANGDGKIVARAYGGPSNFAYLGPINFQKVIKSTVDDALTQYISNVSQGAETGDAEPPVFAAAWFGISGVDSPANVAILSPILSRILSVPVGPRLIICNDAHLLAAPVRLHKDVQNAVTVIAGTGSVVASFRRLDEGEKRGNLFELGRFGGWGWILGDEGGGFHVGREAIRQVVSEHDLTELYKSCDVAGIAPHQNGSHRVQSVLTKRVLELFGVSSPPELLPIIHDADPLSNAPTVLTAVQAYKLIQREKRLSQLAPIVFEAAFTHNDTLALAVLRETSSALARQVTVLLRPDDNTGETTYAPRTVRASDSVICFGGSLAGIQAYRDMILRHLADNGHVFKHIEFVMDPSGTGAMSLALQFKSV